MDHYWNTQKNEKNKRKRRKCLTSHTRSIYDLLSVSVSAVRSIRIHNERDINNTNTKGARDEHKKKKKLTKKSEFRQHKKETKFFTFASIHAELVYKPTKTIQERKGVISCRLKTNA